MTEENSCVLFQAIIFAFIYHFHLVTWIERKRERRERESANNLASNISFHLLDVFYGSYITYFMAIHDLNYTHDYSQPHQVHFFDNWWTKIFWMAFFVYSFVDTSSMKPARNIQGFYHKNIVENIKKPKLCLV